VQEEILVHNSHPWDEILRMATRNLKCRVPLDGLLRRRDEALPLARAPMATFLSLGVPLRLDKHSMDLREIIWTASRPMRPLDASCLVWMIGSDLVDWLLQLWLEAQCLLVVPPEGDEGSHPSPQEDLRWVE
jgi:hypothetical protein